MKLAAAAEGQKILGVSPARWYQLIHEEGFPKPIDVLSCGAIYDAAELEVVAARRKARAAARAAGSRHRAQTTGGDRKPVPALPTGLTLP
jgi:predicted DNA-binding transcriptional regulator AlpA